MAGTRVLDPVRHRVCPSDRWLICLGFYVYGPGPLCMGVPHSGRLPACIFASCLYCYTVFLICCSWGMGFATGGGEGGPVLQLQQFSPGV